MAGAEFPARDTVVPPRKFASCIARFTLENRDTGAQRSKTAAIIFTETRIAETSAPPSPPGMERSPVQVEASQSSPSRQIQTQIRRRIQRTKHKPAPKSDDRTDIRTPDQATIPNRRRYTSSGRSDREPSPRNHKKPRSIPNKAHTPSARRDTEPSQPAQSAATLGRNPELQTRCHGRQDLAVPT